MYQVEALVHKVSFLVFGLISQKPGFLPFWRGPRILQFSRLQRQSFLLGGGVGAEGHVVVAAFYDGDGGYQGRLALAWRSWRLVTPQLHMVDLTL